MPFYGDAFFNAVKGKKPFVKVAYLQLLWHYWSHRNCEGLENNDYSLMELSGAKESEWPEVYEVLFKSGEFFYIGEDGFWHQKRASIEWQKAKIIMERNSKGGKNRWHGISKAERKQIASNAGKMSAVARFRNKPTN